MTRELVIWLLQQGHQPRHLRPQASSEAEQLQQALQEAIGLREQGHAALSLELLQRLQAEGLSSPWILDNAARALSDLGQPDQAMALWQGLAEHDDPEVARVAADTLRRGLEPLLQRLREICRQWHWAPRHLPQLEGLGGQNLLLGVLEEAIACREAGRAELSLALLEEGLKQGWTSPWLRDNQARALVHQGRRDEACAIWEQLQDDDDATAAGEARRMLGQYQPARIRHPQRDRVLGLEQQGLAEQAEVALLEGLLETPEDGELWGLLEQRQAAPGADGLLEQELAAVNRRLAAEERLLAHLEQQLQG